MKKNLIVLFSLSCLITQLRADANSSVRNLSGFIADSTLPPPADMADTPDAKDIKKKSKIPTTRSDFLEIIRKAKEKLKVDPNSSDAYLDLGYASRNLDQYAADLEYTNKSIELNPDVAVAYAERAMAYSGLHQQEKALEDLDRAIKMDPNNSAFHSHRGWIFAKQKQYEKAIEACTKSIAIWAGYSPAFFCRGRCYLQLKEYDKAIADLTEAIKLFPNEVSDYYTDRAYAYLAKHDTANALKDLVVSIRIEPNERLAYIYKATALSKSGANDEAVVYLNHVIQNDPKDATALVNRAILYRVTREFDKALADLDRAQQIDSKLAAVYRERGLVLLNRNEATKAIAEFQKAVALDPDDTESLNRISYATFLEKRKTGDTPDKASTSFYFDRPWGPSSKGTVRLIPQVITDMSANVPSNFDFDRVLKRDGEAYFQKTLEKPVKAEFESLRDMPTVGEKYPLYF